jgi:hypothetical protein
MKRAGPVAVLIAVVLAGVYVLNWLGVIAFSSMSGSDVSSTIARELTTKVGTDVKVACPTSIPEKKGGIEDCTADAGHGVTMVRLVQDDSSGHFHYVVNDPGVLVPAEASPTPTPAAATTLATSVTVACVNAGGSVTQCGCIEHAIQQAGTDGDLIRAVNGYNGQGRLPDDLAVMADGCRTGA